MDGSIFDSLGYDQETLHEQLNPSAAIFDARVVPRNPSLEDRLRKKIEDEARFKAEVKDELRRELLADRRYGRRSSRMPRYAPNYGAHNVPLYMRGVEGFESSPGVSKNVVGSDPLSDVDSDTEMTTTAYMPTHGEKSAVQDPADEYQLSNKGLTFMVVVLALLLGINLVWSSKLSSRVEKLESDHSRVMSTTSMQASGVSRSPSLPQEQDQA